MKRIVMIVEGCKDCPFRHAVLSSKPLEWKCWRNNATWHSAEDIKSVPGYIPDWCPLPKVDMSKPETWGSSITGAKQPRVRILCEVSRYKGEIGYIVNSSGNGTFLVCVGTEGEPRIILEPKDVEPC